MVRKEPFSTYQDGSMRTKNTDAGCNIKGEGRNIVINVDSMVIVFQT